MLIKGRHFLNNRLRALVGFVRKTILRNIADRFFVPFSYQIMLWKLYRRLPMYGNHRANITENQTNPWEERSKIFYGSEHGNGGDLTKSGAENLAFFCGKRRPNPGLLTVTGNDKAEFMNASFVEPVPAARKEKICPIRCARVTLGGTVPARNNASVHSARQA